MVIPPHADVIEHSGHRYHMIMGSDLERDGMFLELIVDGHSEAPPLEMFYSDVTGTFTLNTLQTASIPLEIIEHFIQEGAPLSSASSEGHSRCCDANHLTRRWSERPPAARSTFESLGRVHSSPRSLSVAVAPLVLVRCDEPRD